MNYKKNIFTFLLALVVFQGVFASVLADEKEFDINSIVYIEDDEEIELGFNTADYLPEGFNPNEVYFDINTIVYVEEAIEEVFFSAYLPLNFDVYAYPTDVQSINYIDANDRIELGFNTAMYLPKTFNAFTVK